MIACSASSSGFTASSVSATSFSNLGIVQSVRSSSSSLVQPENPRTNTPAFSSWLFSFLFFKDA
jgi:hypothetical protein